MIYPVLLCGGEGTRLWPLSNAKTPKQFLSLENGISMFQTSLKRIINWKLAAPIVTANQKHKSLLQKQFRAVDCPQICDFILEPHKKNTAAAALSAAFHIHNKDPNGILMLCPSDHYIETPNEIASLLKIAKQQLHITDVIAISKINRENSKQYGYFKLKKPIDQSDDSLLEITSFIEKPTNVQMTMLNNDHGSMLNTGIYLVKAKKLLKLCKQLQPELYAHAKKAFNLAIIYESAQTNINQNIMLNEQAFNKIQPLSFDQAIIEPLSLQSPEAISLLELKSDWQDLGSFASLETFLAKDDGVSSKKINARLSKFKNIGAKQNPVMSFNQYAKYEHLYHDKYKKIANLTGIKEPVLTLNDAIKQSIGKYQNAPNPFEVIVSDEKDSTTIYEKKPWGHYQILNEGPFFKTKLIHVEIGQKTSLQRHMHRSEHWIIVKGTAKVEIEGKSTYLFENQTCYIPQTAIHRLENPGKIDLILIEVQYGKYLEEDDISRLSDCYGRK